MATPKETVDAGGIEIPISNPDKVFFPETGATKRDLVAYFLAVGDGALKGVWNRPSVLKRYPGGATGEFFFQKRCPDHRPDFVNTVEVHYPSGRSAALTVIDSLATLIWTVNLGCIDLNPWPVRAGDTDHPDELRIDLDPTPQATFADVRNVALVVRDVLTDFGMVGFPKTSGSRGIHINVRIAPLHDFGVIRRCALALGREVERRVPDLATTAWWKEQRHGVFIDYNQNARDRTVASVYSVRPVPNARVSCALEWDEVADVDPNDLRLDTVPQRFATKGDPGATIDDVVYSLDPLIQRVEEDAANGIGDAPWPPHFAKQEGEPARVQPSRARKA